MKNEVEFPDKDGQDKNKASLAKILGQATAILAIGFLLLNATFVFFAICIYATNWLVGHTIGGVMGGMPSPIAGIVPLGLIIYFSFLIYRSKLSTFIKATYTLIPTAVSLVIIGISLYRWPLAAYFLGFTVCFGIIYYLYQTKRQWQYYYSVILVGFTLFLMSLFGVDI